MPLPDPTATERFQTVKSYYCAGCCKTVRLQPCMVCACNRLNDRDDRRRDLARRLRDMNDPAVQKAIQAMA